MNKSKVQLFVKYARKCEILRFEFQKSSKLEGEHSLEHPRDAQVHLHCDLHSSEKLLRLHITVHDLHYFECVDMYRLLLHYSVQKTLRGMLLKHE